MHLKNLVYIDIQGTNSHLGHVYPCQDQGVHEEINSDHTPRPRITYTKDCSLEIGNTCKVDKRITIYPSLVNNVRKLRLNRRGKHSGKQLKDKHPY